MKPVEAFRPNPKMRSGWDSWCRDCYVEVTAQWRADARDHAEAQRQLKRGPYSDPVAYSKSVCLHIETFTQRAIERFEARTGKEAPPHLTAILAMARQLADEQKPAEKKPGLPRVCPICDVSFESYRPEGVYCSQKCRDRANFLRIMETDPDRKRAQCRAAAQRRLERDPGWRQRKQHQEA